MTQGVTQAPPSDWIESVAKVLPHPHGQVNPYELSDAVAELGAYAASCSSSAWHSSRSVSNHRNSLQAEVDFQSRTLGKRLAATVGSALVDLNKTSNREAIIQAAARFVEAWRTDTAIAAAFEDLCEEAKSTASTSTRLRQLSALIASQLGAAATSHFSPLREAADLLISSKEYLSRWRGQSVHQPLDETERLRLALHALTDAAVGSTVVWAVYSHATARGPRTELGSVTVLRPDWALPSAFDDDGQDFPERAELREIRAGVRWLDELQSKSLEVDSHLVLVRVDLGERPLAGASEDARRLIHALLAMPVTVGGVSWHDTGTTAILQNGSVRVRSGGRIRTDPARYEDGYGIEATAEILHELADPLSAALHSRSIPDNLVESLGTLREARMTDHRDVRFNGARPVSPRFATALEDHAMELIASVLGVRTVDLAAAMEFQYALRLAEARTLDLLMAPFEEKWNAEQSAQLRALEAMISHLENDGTRVVNVGRVVANVKAIRKLPLTSLQRSDFEEGILICTDAHREHVALTQALDETGIIRARHRRVRNAVNHGLPLSSATLGSIREYAESTSQRSLELALAWFVGSETGPALVETEKRCWSDRINRVVSGLSWANANGRT